MGAFAVAFILISGYIFVARSKHQRLITRREDGHRYYFRCGAYGILFCGIGIILAISLDILDVPSFILGGLGWSVENLIHNTSSFTANEYTSLKVLIGSFFTIPISFVGAFLDNICRDNQKSLQRIRDRDSGALEKFLAECGTKFQTVLITLSSRKVYVGIVHEIPIECGEVEHFSILPILSGYRDKDSLTVKFTTNYYVYYENQLDDDGEPKSGFGAALDDFIEVIPVSKLDHVGRFDIDTYKNFHSSTNGNTVRYPTMSWMEQSYTTKPPEQTKDI
jgi:hypothetical protein